MSYTTYEINVNVVKDEKIVGTLDTELVINNEQVGDETWNGIEIADSLIEGLIETYPTLTDLEYALNDLMEDKDMSDIEREGLTLII